MNHWFMIIIQIGNCVGAANHRHFIAFLISAIISMIYVSFMSTYVGLHIWPPLSYNSLSRLNQYNSREMVFRAIREVILALLSSALLLSTRGLVLVYLFVSSVSVGIGLGILLWQQLCYIYEGKTYLNHLSSHGNDEVVTKDCQNLSHFFGCPYSLSRYLPTFRKKRHKKWKPRHSFCHYTGTLLLFLHGVKVYYYRCCFLFSGVWTYNELQPRPTSLNTFTCICNAVLCALKLWRIVCFHTERWKMIGNLLVMKSKHFCL